MNRKNKKPFTTKTTYKSYSIFSSVYYELNMIHFLDKDILQV